MLRRTNKNKGSKISLIYLIVIQIARRSPATSTWYMITTLVSKAPSGHSINNSTWYRRGLTQAALIQIWLVQCMLLEPIQKASWCKSQDHLPQCQRKTSRAFLKNQLNNKIKIKHQGTKLIYKATTTLITQCLKPFIIMVSTRPSNIQTTLTQTMPLFWKKNLNQKMYLIPSETTLKIKRIQGMRIVSPGTRTATLIPIQVSSGRSRNIP